MSVLNRSMFQQAVNRQQGTPPMGENSTIFNFGEYGGTYDLKEPGFQRVLRNYLKEVGIVGIQGIDTRALTIHLRNNGMMNMNDSHDSRNDDDDDDIKFISNSLKCSFWMFFLIQVNLFISFLVKGNILPK